VVGCGFRSNSTGKSGRSSGLLLGASSRSMGSIPPMVSDGTGGLVWSGEDDGREDAAAAAEEDDGAEGDEEEEFLRDGGAEGDEGDDGDAEEGGDSDSDFGEQLDGLDGADAGEAPW
jgi:hypothetical protein